MKVRFDRERLRRAISASGTTIQALEDICGFNRHYLHTALQRAKRMDYFRLDRVACALGCHPSEFEL